MKRDHIIALAAVFTVAFLGACSKGPKGTLTLQKNRVAPGETITAQFTASKDFPENAWVGVIPSSVPHGKESDNDANDVAYEYLSKRESGTLTFTAPTQAGSWDLRMSNTDDGTVGKEVTSVTFTVDMALAPTKPSLNLNKINFAPGEALTVTWGAPATYPANAWIGIVPATTPHGSSDANGQSQMASETLNNRTSGTWNSTAPGEPGNYEIRMNDGVTGASETAAIPFSVK